MSYRNATILCNGLNLLRRNGQTTWTPSTASAGPMGGSRRSTARSWPTALTDTSS